MHIPDPHFDPNFATQRPRSSNLLANPFIKGKKKKKKKGKKKK